MARAGEAGGHARPEAESRHQNERPDAARGTPFVFYFDLASPECWLEGERLLVEGPHPCEWIPILAPDPMPAFRCAEESDIWRLELERRAPQPVRWPPEVPFDSAFAMRAATFAAGAGKTVAFALAAFRQAYCGGRDLGDPDNVLIAAAACEIHPRALLKGADLA